MADLVVIEGMILTWPRIHLNSASLSKAILEKRMTEKEVQDCVDWHETLIPWFDYWKTLTQEEKVKEAQRWEKEFKEYDFQRKRKEEERNKAAKLEGEKYMEEQRLKDEVIKKQQIARLLEEEEGQKRYREGKKERKEQERKEEDERWERQREEIEKDEKELQAQQYEERGKEQQKEYTSYCTIL